MPTGYTAGIKDGMSFEQFAWGCARAFGALIMMRDEPSDAPIPDEFKPSDYHEKALAEAEAERARLIRMSDEEIATAAKQHNEKELADWRTCDQENRALKEKYEAMLAAARAWNPPTSEHRELKNFMIQQITQSIDFDCSQRERPVPITPKQWHENAVKKNLWSIKYHTEYRAKEIQTVKARNQWIKDLRESLSKGST